VFGVVGKILRFNGGLFASPKALALDKKAWRSCSGGRVQLGRRRARHLRAPHPQLTHNRGGWCIALERLGRGRPRAGHPPVDTEARPAWLWWWSPWPPRTIFEKAHPLRLWRLAKDAPSRAITIF